MEKYYGNSWFKVVEQLNSNIHKGLYEYECTLRRENENNRIDLPYSKGVFRVFFESLKQRYLIVYIISIIFFLLNKFYIIGIISVVLVIFNLSIKLYTESKKEKEIEFLQNLNTSHVLVLREGIERLIEAEDLVKGDIIYFRKNSIIPADIRIIDSENLKVDERGITGDSFIKEKDSIKIDYNVKSFGEISNMAFRGSVVKDGSGKGIVVEVGKNTQLGKLVKIMNNNNDKSNTLVKNIDINIFKVMICLLLSQAILILVLPGNLLNKNQILAQGIFSIISILFTFILVFYKKEFKRKILIEDNIELNNISSLSLLDEVKIFCLEKIGTISKNELYVDKLYTNEKLYVSNTIDITDINIKRLLEISLLCNNARYNIDSDYKKGNIFELAYIKFGLENSMHKDRLEGLNRRKFELGNSSDRNIITTINKNSRGFRANSRGNIDALLKCCTHILINGIEREITSEDIIKIKLTDLSFSKEGFLTEAFAYRSFNYEPSKYENIESNLVFVGVIALENSLVDDILDDINKILDDGILPIIFTNEGKLSAEVFGRKIGLISSEEQIVLGSELENLSEDELIKKVSKGRIYCKLTPNIKNKIIELYYNDDYKFVAEGESISDLSIISLANMGIVKGKGSMLLQKMGDIFAEKSSIKAFFDLKDRAVELKESVVEGLSIYSIICLTEIILLNFQYYFSKDALVKEYFIILLNIFLMSPIILLNILCGNKACKGRKAVLRGILFITIPIVSIYFIKSSLDTVAFLIIGGMAIIDTIINCRIFSKGNLKFIKIFIVAILIYVVLLSVLIFFLGFKLNLLSTLVIVWVLFIFMIADLIIKKW